MKELPWIAELKRHLGLSEVVGSRHNPTILQWHSDMKQYSDAQPSWFKDDETPWCGLAVGHALGTVGRYVIKDWFRAGAWDDDSKMTRLKKPAYGAIAVKKRVGGNHVFFIVGKNAKGQIMGLGGNQGNKISIIPFNLSDIHAIMWPSLWSNGQCVKSEPAPERYNLPVVDATGKFGGSEA